MRLSLAAAPRRVMARVRAQVWDTHIGDWIGLTLLLLPATFMLWYPGLQTTHDGFYHKSRFLELDMLLRTGIIYPRWLPHVSFFYGSPVLHFYPPLIYYVAEWFRLLGWGYLAAYEWMIGLGMVAAGWSMFYFARRWGRLTGWIAALVYMYWPYHMALAYVRGAQAELWALVWYPLILARLARLSENRGMTFDPLLSLLVAALILTHHLSALAFMPVALAWLGWRAWQERNVHYALQGLVSVGVGIGLSAFYWLPVLVDIRWVWAGQPVETARRELLANLAPLTDMISPYWAHRYVPFTGVRAASPMPRVGTVWVILGLGSALLRWRHLSREMRHTLMFFTLVLVTATFMLTELSRPVWATVPLIHYLQFPWRLQSIIGLAAGGIAGLGLGAGWALSRSRLMTAGGLAFLALSLMAGALPGLRYDIAQEPRSGRPLVERDMDLSILPAYDYLRALSLREFRETWLFEYMPVWAAGSRMDFFLPPQQPLPDTPPLDVTVQLEEQHPLRRVFRVRSPTAWTLALHQFYFPAWEARVDDQIVPTRPAGPLGLLAVDLPPGEHRVEVRYGATPIQRVAEFFSGLIALGWGVTVFRRDRRLLIIPLLVGGFLVAATWPTWAGGAGTIRPAVQNVQVGDRIVLLGSYVPRTEVQPGERVWFVLYWLALAPPQERYKVIVHLATPDGQPVAVADTEPGFFFTPTTRWMQGEIMEDWYMVEVPPDLAPGEYLLLTGMYPLERVENLPLVGGRQVGGRVVVGKVRVRAAP